MSRFTRRSVLKGAAAMLPSAGMFGAGVFGSGVFGLPSLARAIQTSSTPQQRPKVKITDVRTAQVLVHGPQTHVRVYTDSVDLSSALVTSTSSQQRSFTMARG